MINDEHISVIMLCTPAMIELTLVSDCRYLATQSSFQNYTYIFKETLAWVYYELH